METNDDASNNCEIISESAVVTGGSGKENAADGENTSEHIRVYINNKGHRVKVMKIEDEIPPNILRPKTGLRLAPTIVPKKSVERLEVLTPDNKRNCRLKPNEITEENARGVRLKSNEIVDENIEPKCTCSDNTPINYENETMHTGREAGDGPEEWSTCKTNTVQDVEEKLKKSNKVKSNVVTLPKNTDSVPKLVKPETSTAYDREQMKAYIKEKRRKQALKRAEEERLKIEAVEIQRLKLEQLKEVCQTIVKKCVRKVKDDDKPEWLGPLEEDDLNTKTNLKKNEVFLPPSKKQKLQNKPTTNTCSTKLRLSKSKETVIAEESCKIEKSNKVNKEKEIDDNEFDNKNAEPLIIPNDLPNFSDKIGKLSNSIKMNQILQSQKPLEIETANNQPNNETHDQASVSNIHGVKSLETLNVLGNPHLLKSKSWHNFSESRLDFHKQIKGTADKTCIIPEAKQCSSNEDEMIGKPPKANQESLHTKLRIKSRHPLKNKIKSSSRKEIVNKDKDSKTTHKEMQKGDLESGSESSFSGGPIAELNGAVLSRASADNLLPTPDWMKSFVNQPNPFRFINVVKLKLALQQRDQILQLQKLENKQNHFEVTEDTDAPSIESMEDGFKHKHAPLKLSDLKLNLPASLKSDSNSCPLLLNNPLLSDLEFRDSTYTTKGSIKSLMSSVVSEAPLIIPPTLQSLTLKSKIDLPSRSSTSVSTGSVSEHISGVQGLVPPTDMLINQKNPRPEFLSPPSKDFNGMHTATENVQYEKQSPKREEERFEFGKVFTPSALHLQFQAELSKLDVFDHSIAQVMATEKLRSFMSRASQLPHLVPKVTSSKVIESSQPESAVGSQEKLLASVTLSETPTSTSHIKKTSDSKHIYSDVLSNKTSVSESNSKSKKNSKTGIPLKLRSENKTSHSEPSKPVLSDRPLYSSDSNRSSISEHISSNNTSISECISENKEMSYDGNVQDELKISTPIKSAELVATVASSNSTFMDSTSIPVHSISEAVSGHDTTFNENIDEASNLNNESIQSNKHLMIQKWKPIMDEYSLQVFEQLIKDEDLRIEHQKTVIKLRQKALVDRAKAEIAMIQIQKVKLRENGHSDLVTNLKKKQRGILMKMKQDQDEIQRTMKRELVVSQDRKLALMQQQQIIKMHLSTKNMLRKIKSGDNSSKKRMVVRSTSVTTLNESSSLTDISTNFREALDEQKRILMEREKKIALRRRMAEELITRQKRLNDEERKVKEMEKLIIRRKPLGGIKKIENEADINIGESKSPGPSQSSISEQLVSKSKTALSTSTPPEELSKVCEDLSKNSLQSVAIASSSCSKTIDYSEGFESPDSSETPKAHNSYSSHKPSTEAKTSPNKRSSMVAIRVPLSPRLHSRSRQRYSSGSDDSIHLSQTETMSEQSDMEVRISVLKEQLRQRKLEAEKLRREQMRAQRERLKAKEQSLLKQIQAYETYISQAHKELDRESELSVVPITRPQIKQPKVAEKVTFRRSEAQQVLPFNELRKKPTVSDEESVSIKSVSEASSLETTIQSPGQVQEQDIASTNEERNDVYSGEDIDEVLSQTSEGSKEVKTIGDSLSKSNEEWFDAESVFQVIKEDPVLNGFPTPFRNVTERKYPRSKDKMSTPNSSVEDQSNTASASRPISEAEREFKEYTQSGPSTVKTISEAEISPGEQIDSAESSVTHSHEEVSTAIQSNELLLSDHIPESQSENITENVILEENIEVTGLDKSVQPFHEDTLGSENSLHSSPSCSLKDIYTETDNTSDTQISNSNILNNQDSKILNDTKEPFEKSSYSSSESCDSNFQVDNLKDFVDSQTHLDEIDVPLETDITNSLVACEETKKNSEKSKLLNLGHSDSEERSELSRNESSISTNEETENKVQDFIKIIVTEKSEHCYKSEDKDQKVISHLNEVNENITSSKQNEQAERITDSILNQLLTEALHVQKKDSHVEYYEDNENEIVEDLTNKILHSYLEDATESMVYLYQEKVKLKIDVDVRHRVQEIMNESLSSPRSTLRAQDFMVTAYDVLSPDSSHSPTLSESGKDLLDAEFFSSVSPSKSAEKVDANAGIGVGSGTDNEGFWFDEDIGLGRTRREAEELRRQQLQIEQEIQQLEQAQEQIPSYYYVREIPNKPPPPYTPPGQASRSRRSICQADNIPTHQNKIEVLVTEVVEFLCEMISENKDLALVQPPEDFLTDDKSVCVYRKFLFDLTRQLFCEVTSSEHDEDILPWNKTNYRRRRTISSENKEAICYFINKQVSILFEFESTAVKENLVIRWSRKKRDRVDELLVRETQEEERDWTDYSEDEMNVKNQVSLSIWDQLLTDTASALSIALQKKIKYCQQS